MKINSQLVGLVLHVLVLALCCLSSSNSLSHVIDEHETMNADKHDMLRATQIVRDYISKCKGWREENFRIQFMGRDGYILEFWVIHKDDEAASIPGSGKSVGVSVDMTQNRVIKELHFQ